MTHTTYSDLTSAAALRLTHALEAARAMPGFGSRTGADELIVAHGDLTAALAHLGRAVVAEPCAARTGHPARGADARLVRLLAQRGVPRDWSAPRPAEGTASHALLEAGRLVRAAADLWATHRTAAGAPRSPEASRMRHPSMLGAAIREWRELVGLAGAVADTLCAQDACLPPTCQDRDTGTAPDSHLGVALRDYPRPPSSAAPSEAPAPVGVTVARPGPHRAGGPLEDIVARVECLHRYAWTLAHSGQAPAPALANLAVVGVLLGAAAAQAHLRAARLASPGSDRESHLAAAERARQAGDRWSVIASRVHPLRTLHPPTTVLQLERLDLARLLERANSRTWADDPARTAHALGQACARWDEVAGLCVTALRAAHERGDLYLMGRGLPGDVVTRHPELLDAKLSDRLVGAPVIVVRRLEAAYRAVGSRRSTSGSGAAPAA